MKLSVVISVVCILTASLPAVVCAQVSDATLAAVPDTTPFIIESGSHSVDSQSVIETIESETEAIAALVMQGEFAEARSALSALELYYERMCVQCNEATNVRESLLTILHAYRNLTFALIREGQYSAAYECIALQYEYLEQPDQLFRVKGFVPLIINQLSRLAYTASVNHERGYSEEALRYAIHIMNTHHRMKLVQANAGKIASNITNLARQYRSEYNTEKFLQMIEILGDCFGAFKDDSWHGIFKDSIAYVVRLTNSYFYYAYKPDMNREKKVSVIETYETILSVAVQRHTLGGVAEKDIENAIGRCNFAAAEARRCTRSDLAVSLLRTATTMARKKDLSAGAAKQVAYTISGHMQFVAAETSLGKNENLEKTMKQTAFLYGRYSHIPSVQEQALHILVGYFRVYKSVSQAEAEALHETIKKSFADFYQKHIAESRHQDFTAIVYAEYTSADEYVKKVGDVHTILKSKVVSGSGSVHSYMADARVVVENFLAFSAHPEIGKQGGELIRCLRLTNDTMSNNLQYRRELLGLIVDVVHVLEVNYISDRQRHEYVTNVYKGALSKIISDFTMYIWMANETRQFTDAEWGVEQVSVLKEYYLTMGHVPGVVQDAIREQVMYAGRAALVLDSLKSEDVQLLASA